MGGLFSSEELARPTPTFAKPPPQRSSSAYYRPVLPHDVTSRQNHDHLYRQELQIRESLRRLQLSRRVQAPEASRRIPGLLDISNAVYDQIYTLTPLAEYDPEFLQIKRKITNKRNFKVDSIEKIDNSYLSKAYELKKVQKQAQYPDVEELLLFHGTKKVYVDEICKMNFDWRRCQAHKYGRGVSFSPNSTYASVYSDKNVYNKVMIVAKVLVAKSCPGNEYMNIPPEGFDTSQKGQDRIVIVKYEDNDFCPVYKINYHVMDENVGKGKKHMKRGRTIGNFDLDFLTIYD